MKNLNLNERIGQWIITVLPLEQLIEDANGDCPHMIDTDIVSWQEEFEASTPAGVERDFWISLYESIPLGQLTEGANAALSEMFDSLHTDKEDC
jgi:hypothetical protein